MQKLKNEELNRMSTDEFKKALKVPVVLVLDNIRSLHNVGSAFRTADAFLLESIYLCGVTGTPPNKEIEKTALGATQSVDWTYVKSTDEAIDHLRSKGYKIYSVEQATESVKLNSLGELSKEKCALVFGNEVYGVEESVIEKSDAVIEIPQNGTKHSLNVSVSIGIVLWEFLRDKFNS